MQFLEWSIIGLRAARHVLSHPDQDLSVTLFPMVHLGEQDFYETVYADAATHDVVVIEGVRSKVVARLTRVYRWMSPERLGLIVQPRFPKDLAHVVRADLPGPEFDAIWTTTPRPERIALEAAASAMGLWLRLTATRPSLGRHLCTTDLPDRSEVLAWRPRLASAFEAISTARNDRLSQTVRELLSQTDTVRKIAVIYGAAHMGPLAHDLHDAGLRPVDSRWLTAFAA